MTTIAEKLTIINNAFKAIKQAIINKGGTTSGDVTTYAQAINNIPSGGGSTPVINSLNVTPTTSSQTITASGGVDGYSPINVSAVTSSIDNNITAGNIKKGVTILSVTGSYEGSGGGGGGSSIDVPLVRISDDNGNEIGTHYMNFEDGNGNVFKVVLLDAQYRNASAQWCSNTSTVTNMPLYSNLKNSNVWEAKETATQNTQLILDWCSANDYTSSSCSHCRSQSFTIDGTTYYGQLPNLVEIIHLAKHYNVFDTLDTSASSHKSTNFSSARNIWSSSQFISTTSWFLSSIGLVSTNTKTTNSFTCPVLEIPLS